jgi:5-methylcytosine-specific restriction protein A
MALALSVGIMEQPRGKPCHPFYGSRPWKALVARIIAERGRLCEASDCSTVNRGAGRRIYGDHIRELRDGGPALDPANVMLLCASCHRRKTLLAAKQRAEPQFLEWSGWRS